MRKDINVLKQDAGILKQDVKSLKEEVGILKQDVSCLKEDVKDLQQRMIIVEGKTDNLQFTVNEMQSELAETKREILSLRTTIENVYKIATFGLLQKDILIWRIAGSLYKSWV